MLKLGIVLVLAVVLELSQALPVLEETAFVSECLAANNISQTEFQELIEQSSSEEEDYEEDLDNTERKYKCFVYCLGEKGKILDSNGYLDVGLVEQMEPLSEQIRDVLYHCKKIHDQEEDKCEYAFQMVRCLSENIDQSDDEVTDQNLDVSTNKLNE
ncbi:general odorant-binding protein 57c [Drosophila kikkawai]|uniref:General odorant-binding protein 57c n=1 Tax=Drosophila kikkawai TaxID=30033 RepID=A0A6P4I7Z1_DROKI|nr:general odorant-binding protein 57c [Drosophila kikkawai]